MSSSGSLRDFHDGSHAMIPAVADGTWRRSLAYRVTDEQVRADLQDFKVIPLSVATDRIGLTAMHAARLQALLAAAGHKVDRDVAVLPLQRLEEPLSQLR